MVKEISPPQAGEILRTNPDAVLLDVRSRMEFDYVGHPIGAVFVALKEPPEWEVDPDFTARVKQALQATRPDKNPEALLVLTLCRSGARSMSAAEILLGNGFREVVNIAEGFEGDKDANNHRNNINGWRFHGLPWEQS